MKWTSYRDGGEPEPSIGLFIGPPPDVSMTPTLVD